MSGHVGKKRWRSPPACLLRQDMAPRVQVGLVVDGYAEVTAAPEALRDGDIVVVGT